MMDEESVLQGVDETLPYVVGGGVREEETCLESLV